MKVRMDFVTNSSSSSFILARNSEMNEKQKEAIVEYVEKELLGQVILTPESTEEEIQKVFEEDWQFEDRKDLQQQVREVLKSGKSVYTGWVSFECCDNYYASIFEDIWSILKENGDGNFVAIDDDLSY